jgi:hypothetical protein
MFRFAHSFVCLFVLSLAAHAATHPCALESVPAARLACYDKAFPPPPEVQEAAAERARAEFGDERSRVALRDPGQVVEQVDPQSIESVVVRVDHSLGARSVTLEDGQVWTQTDARSGGHVRAGDTVQVKRAILGGYHLVTPNGVILRVRRTR